MMRDYRQLLRPRSGGARWVWSLVIALLAAAGWMSSLAVQRGQYAHRLQTSLEVARARLARPAPARPNRVAVDTQRRWEVLAAERAFAWYPVFRALEQASSPDIELLEFLPDKANRRLALRGEARSMAGLTGYLVALNAQAPLAEVYLAHQKNVSRAGMSIVSFEIRARLSRRGDVPGA